MLELVGYSELEPLHRGRRSSVFRGRRKADGLSVVVKTSAAEFPISADLRRLRREFEVGRGNDLAPALPYLVRYLELVTLGSNLALVLEDFGGRSLEDPSERRELSVTEFLDLALAMAQAVRAVHDANLIHLDINPTNFLRNPTTGQLRLCDLSSALRSGEVSSLGRGFSGNPLYASPEQAQPTGAAVDHRSDLYSLGVTLFELLTGRVPFGGDDPLEILHRHRAAAPPVPRDVRRDVPQALSDVLLKLLSKDPNDRYQSARGLCGDFVRCRRELASKGAVPSFGLASEDTSPLLLMPQRLYGRDRELSELSGALARTAAGGNVLVLVSGEPGVGKSALVERLRSEVQAQRGHFCAGKFEALRANAPYSAFSAALRGFVRAVLVRPESEVRRCRDRILAATGPSCQLLVRLIPELGKLLGPQPEAPPLEPEQAQARFRHLVLNLIDGMTTPENPLLLFVDDLQWADPASVSLIEELTTPDRFSHLMLVAAYRESEVQAGLGASLGLEKILSTESAVRVRLEPLDEAQVEEFIADCLPRSAEVHRPLAQLVLKKTGGNPFFLRQFLKLLHADRLLSFDEKTQVWNWNAEGSDAQSITANVGDLTARRIDRLEPRARRVLQHAACLGNEFATATLAVVLERDEPSVLLALSEALHEELIERVRVEEDTGPLSTFTRFRFSHDHVQQAAYALIPDAERAGLHLSIGRLLLAVHSGSEQEERVFQILDHLIRGVHLVTQRSELLKIAELCLIAGRRAKAANAYSAATKYLRSALELLGPHGWRDNYEMALALHTEHAESSYLHGELVAMRESCAEIEEGARALVDKVPAFRLEIVASMARYEMADAIARARRALKGLGVDLPANPSRTAAALRVVRMAFRMRNETEQTLLARPRMQDRRTLAAIELLALIATPAYLMSPNLFPVIVCEVLTLALKHGASEWEADAFLGWSAIQIAALGKIEKGYAVGAAAPRIIEQLSAARRRGRTQTNFNLLVRHWKEPLRSTIEPLGAAVRDGLEHGDLAHASVAAVTQTFYMLTAGFPLAEVEETALRHERLLSRLGQERFRRDARRMLQLVACLQGKAKDPEHLRGEFFDYENAQAEHEQAGDRAALAALSYERALLAYLYGAHRAALDACRASSQRIDSLLGTVYPPALDFLSALVRARLLTARPKDLSEREERAEILRSLKRLERLAKSAPENQAHRVHLIRAELARLRGDNERALQEYEAAIEQAGRQGYAHEQAMALECAGRFHAALGRARLASTTLLAARNAWRSWGAAAKATALESEFSMLLAPQHKLLRHSRRDFTMVEDAHHGLDLVSIMKASQVIVGEIQLAKLVRRLLALTMENTGAQRGFLLLDKNGQLRIEAAADVDDAEAFANLRPLPLLSEAGGMLAVAIVEYVARVAELVVHGDVAADPLFSHDPYVASRRPLSILCVPLVSQGALVGIVYLENNRMRRAFSAERVEVLQLLSSLAAIALENARLYGDVAAAHALESRLAEAQARFVPVEFLRSLQRESIVEVSLGDNIRKEMSILFSDVRGFTELVEGMPASEHIGFINGYLGHMEPPIVENGGFVDSYLGDGIMALFEGAPENAVRAAVEMSRALARFNEERRAAGLPAVEMGVGINSGPLTLGTIGGPKRIKCGVIGDPVNVASRIEALTRHYRSAVLISHHTQGSLGSARPFDLRSVDRVRLLGKTSPIDLYEVLDAEPPLRADGKRRTREAFQRARALYEGGKFEDAERLFHQCLVICPEDGAAAHLAARCRRYRSEAPAAWDGIDTLTEK